MTGSDLDRAKLISGGVNFILGKSVAEYELPDHEKTQNVFLKEALLLKQALSLCSSFGRRANSHGGSFLRVRKNNDRALGFRRYRKEVYASGSK